jgi:hypothetical protein
MTKFFKQNSEGTTKKVKELAAEIQSLKAIAADES